MYSRPLVPDNYVVPQRLDGEGFHLRMLRTADVVKDFAAVAESAQRLVGFMSPADRWPEGLTIDENLVDLGWHEREFTLRHSFAYTVMNDDESRCLGCCYIYPSDRLGFEAMAFYWAREKEYQDGFDSVLGAAFRAFVAGFPFSRVAYPGRDIPWSAW
jgi:hypothetical protein